MIRSDLQPDCGRCAGLCCLALAFDAGPAFATDKAAGEGCRHLSPEHRCGIYADRPQRGYSGCVGYSCAGAGQRVTAWFPAEPQGVEAQLVFRILAELLQLRWQLEEAGRWCPVTAVELQAELSAGAAALAELSEAGPAAVREAPVDLWRRRTQALLPRVGQALGGRRAGHPRLVLR